MFRRPTTGDGVETKRLLDDSEDDAEPKETEGEMARKQVAGWLCYAALAGVQVSFVVGAVYLKRGLQLLDKEEAGRFNPLLFVFFRTGIAGPLLMFWAIYSTGRVFPDRGHLVSVILLGVFLFLNQGMYILGLNLSGALVASCMQPAIPVFTHLIAVLFRSETSSLQKVSGILLAVAGAVCMVLRGADRGATTNHLMTGNLCLVGNTLSMAFYFLVAKGLTQDYAAVSITGWAYVLSATCLAITCTAAAGVGADDWHLPQPLWGPLAFWVVMCSVFAYFTMTWASAYQPASTVAAFQCLQPLVGTMLSVLVLHEIPTLWDLGSLGVIGGLFLVTWQRHAPKQ